jgi:hypothetical protein
MTDSISRKLLLAKDFIRSQNGGHIAPMGFTEEEINPQVQDDLSYHAVALEDTNSCIRVNYSFPEESLCSEFSYFEDGKQKTINIGHISTLIGEQVVIIPIHFFSVGAVILHRTDQRELRVWNSPEMKSGILAAKSLIPDQGLVQNFEREGLEVIDINAIGGDYSTLRQRALQKAKDLRLETETKLITKWRTSEDNRNSILVVDGTLMNFRNEDNVEKCVGVSKSFGSRYFNPSEHNRILQSSEFERSWAFRFHDENEDQRLGVRERISWYLRLRKRINTEPEFGLVRVEISIRHIDHVQELTERISRSLLSERLPTAYPRSRWDKHLYPIQACENYLASIMPSSTTIFSTMKG